MLFVLLAKDLRRAWRNPLPWAINLIVPLAMTALLGLVFGGSANNALGTIHFAVVNEDQPILTRLLRGAVTQVQDGAHFEPVFMERAAALKLVNAGKISAVVIIETNFVRNYLTAREPVSLKLIKNPAESIHPAVMEELLGVAVTALNVVSRNFNSEFPEFQRVLAGGEDYHQAAILVEQTGDRLTAVRHFINPPLVGYENHTEVRATNGVGGSQSPDASEAKSTNTKTPTIAATGNLAGIFGFLLLGLSAMFLLFLGQNAMTDLHRELRKRTFERYQTMHQQLWPFIVGKIIFAVFMLLFCSLVMLGGGGLIFKIHWENVPALAAMVLGYSCFIAALFAALVAIMPDERRAGVLNNVVSLALGLVGGCAFPPERLPAFMREHITPLMPSHWFADTARRLQFGGSEVAWALVLLKLMVCSLALTALAAWLFRKKFTTGLRA